MSSDRKNDDRITIILLLIVSRSAFQSQVEKPSDTLRYDIQF